MIVLPDGWLPHDLSLGSIILILNADRSPPSRFRTLAQPSFLGHVQFESRLSLSRDEPVIMHQHPPICLLLV
jgi:hypothetical protein